MNRRFKEQLFLAFGILVIVIAMGTILFSVTEGWGWLDAFYYTGITLTTIGFGDLVPVSTFGKIATILFGFLGIGIVFYTANLLARYTFELEAKHIDQLLERRVQRRLKEEEHVKEEVEEEVEKKTKEIEKEAVKIAKEITETKKKKK